MKKILLALIAVPVVALAQVGGWYPVIFNDYDATQIDRLADGVKQGQALKIIVIYDANRELADRIVNEIKSFTIVPVELRYHPSVNTDTTQYNRDQVVATVYTR